MKSIEILSPFSQSNVKTVMIIIVAYLPSSETTLNSLMKSSSRILNSEYVSPLGTSSLMMLSKSNLTLSSVSGLVTT